MKQFLVDVPVKINIWIRPDCQRKQFEVIRKARPSILFIQSDGGRNEDEWKLIYENRKIYDEEIDWECTVYKLYEDENLGLYAKGAKTHEFIWQHVDRCIFLEDDQIPSVSFFQFCAENLERYKNDERIECICGMNHLGVYSKVSYDYFFSRAGSIWGIATWKRCYNDRDSSFSYGKNNYIMGLLKANTRNNKGFRKAYKTYSKSKYYCGHVAFDEFWTEFNMYAQNRVQIIPKYNLISNIGVSSDSEHADDIKCLPHGIRRVFNMKTYELTFPLKHNPYVIPDVEYEKKRNRILGFNHKFVQMFRKVERVLLLILHGEFGKITKKISLKINQNKEK